MSDLSVRWVRGDGGTFTADGGLMGLTAAEGLNEPALEVFSQKAALGDGDLVTGSRVGSRELTFTCKARRSAYNDLLVRALPSFFIASQSYDVQIHRGGDCRVATGCRLSALEIPTENPAKPVTVKLSFLMPEGYFMSEDGFGQNIAGIRGRCGYPYAALGTCGRLYGLYAYAQTVYLENDGDAEAYCKAVLYARGTVVNPRIQTGGGYVRLLATLTAGDTLVIDGKTKSVEKNGANAAALLDKASNFSSLAFATGTNTIGYTADVGANVLDVYVYYNKRFLGA